MTDREPTGAASTRGDIVPRSFEERAIVPRSFLDDVAVFQDLWRRATVDLRPPTPEERLAEEIARRSIRNRLRRARVDWTDRIATAYDVLRGRHVCD